MFPVTFTGFPGAVCSKVTVPDTGESPRRTTTAWRDAMSAASLRLTSAPHLGDRGSASPLEKYPVHVVQQRQDSHNCEQ